jgi:hypothetical protein
LVIGAQGVLGSFIARGFRDAGYVVTRGGRRSEGAEDFLLVDLDRPDTVAQACGEADLVVSTVRHPALAAERAVLRAGGLLLNLQDYPADERIQLSLEPNQPRGLVVDRTGLGGVTGLAAAELLQVHPEADALEFGIMASAREKAGPAGGLFIQRMLGGPRHLETVSVVLPKPFGRRRCLSGEGGAAEVVAPLARGRKARFYICFLPAAVNALVLTLNALRVASRLPDAVFETGRSSLPAELSRQPTCHWAAVSRAGVDLARRVVLGNGDYRSTVGATLVFARALLAAPRAEPRHGGVFGIDELLTLRDLLPALEAHGIRVEAA